MEERVSETEDLGLRRGAFFQCVRENGDRDLERAGGERRRSGETGTFRQPPKVLRFRIFLLHGTERFPQDPSGFRNGWDCHFSFIGIENDGCYSQVPDWF